VFPVCWVDRRPGYLSARYIPMCIPVEINLTLIGLKREGGGGQVAYIGTEES